MNFGGNPLHQATKTTLKQQLNGEKYSHVVSCPNKQRYFELFMRLDLKCAKSFVLINSGFFVFFFFLFCFFNLSCVWILSVQKALY